MNRDYLQNTLTKHIPEEAISYCLQLWEEHQFKFKVKNKRTTKLGDYRYVPKDKSHHITINNDLNQYSFLVTYLHEVAHHRTFIEYGRRVNPHGREWKITFKNITMPVLNPAVFPDDILRKLAAYMRNPKASSCNDYSLMRVLKDYDLEQSIFLGDLQRGELFKLGDRIFKKEELRRTRFVCQEISTGRKYLVSKSAVIEPAPMAAI